jgi:hypothetical protein
MMRFVRYLRLQYQLLRIGGQAVIQVYQMHGAAGALRELCLFLVLSLIPAFQAVTTINRLSGIFSLTNLIPPLSPTRLVI